MANLTLGFLYAPTKTWATIGAMSEERIKRHMLRPILLPLITAAAFFYGTTQVGWQVGDRLIQLDTASAIPISVMFYLALLGGQVVLGLMAHWMSKTYDAESSPIKGVVLMGFAFSPMFLAGITALWPLWWFDIMLGTIATCYAIRLLYMGIPPVMKVPEDRGMLYSSALFLVALVYMVVVLVATAILWEYVAMPTFID